MTTATEAIDRMVAEAEKTLGWSDEGNTKRTPIHTWYNAKFGNPDPGKYAWDWCNGGLTYWAWHSGNEKAVTFGGGYAYTVAHAQEFKDRGLFTFGTAGIRRGDVVFFDWQGADRISAIDHVGVVTGVRADGSVETIEANIEDAVRRKVRTGFEIAGYGRPKYGTGATTPAPVPPTTEEPPVPGTYTPPPFPTGLRPGSARPSAKPLQAALKAAGYLAKTVAPADNYGPNTEAAVDRFYDAHPALGGGTGSWDPIIGPKGWAQLHREAYGGAKPTVPATPAPPVVTPALNEPAHDYRRLTYGGKTVNARTATMLRAARGLANQTGDYRLTQGSYNRGVSASAGTHDGGGVVDINTSGINVNSTLLALRRAGFAAWYRTSAEGFAPHIHACAIGDREMSSGARSQVADYFAGRNGLANRRADSAPASVGRPYPKWAEKYR
jgi:peptidoglycan hydrolase-like protein with peptidoglycan-binding domain